MRGSRPSSRRSSRAALIPWPLLLAVIPVQARAQSLSVGLNPVKGLSLSGGGMSANVQGYLAYEAADLHGGAPPLHGDADVRFADIIATARAFDGHATAAFVYDFRNPTRPIEDAWAAVSKRGLALVAGNHKEPFSLQALNGSPDRTLAEAAIPQALAPDRALGISLGAFRPNASLTVGAYRGNINDDANHGGSLGARATFAPVLSNRNVIHLALAVNRRDAEGGAFAFSAFPATVRTGRPLIATGSLGDLNTVWRFGAEFAVRRGPLLVQSEYLRVVLDRGAGRTAVLEGGYVTASWAITGEVRHYRMSSSPNERAAFGAIAPAHPVGEGGLGAVELVARVSVTDLDRHDLPASGRLTGAAIGMNWVPHPLTRFTLEAVRAWTVEARPERVSLLLARTYLFF